MLGFTDDEFVGKGVETVEVVLAGTTLATTGAALRRDCELDFSSLRLGQAKATMTTSKRIPSTISTSRVTGKWRRDHGSLRSGWPQGRFVYSAR